MIGRKIYVYRRGNRGALFAFEHIAAGERVFRFTDNVDASRILTQSERPNCVLVANFVIALRALELGEEITCDHKPHCIAAVA